MDQQSSPALIAMILFIFVGFQRPYVTENSENHYLVSLASKSRFYSSYSGL